MHASKLPLTIWFWAAFLMATHSNGISALQLQNQLGLGSYRTAWMLCAKLRRAMVNPAREPLSGVLDAVAPQTRLVTDDWPSYQDLPSVRHNAMTLGPMAAHIALPWIHRLFSNLKRWGLGVYHGLRKTNLQHYLDEFVFRFNRRRTRHAAFNTLLGIGARTVPAPYRLLIRKTAWQSCT